MSKLFEHVNKKRILSALTGKKGLAAAQFGFRKGRSTTHAIKKVISLAKEEFQKSYKSRNLCGIITVDIKNAFNSVDWKSINEEISRRGLSEEIQAIINSYLYDRSFIDDDGKKYTMECGVPQGSVLGPLLWNILYDGLLKMLTPEGVKTVAYADDLIIVVKAKTETEVMRLGNHALRNVITWLSSKNLVIAAHKTECCMLSGKKKHGEITFKIQDVKITPLEEIKYLGVMLDKNLQFGKHLMYQIAKANKAAKDLARLMPRMSGPSDKKRILLANVAYSIIMYAVEAWHGVLDIQKYRRIAERTQKTLCLSISRAYRTAGVEALRVITRTIPIHLSARERCRRGKGSMTKEENRKETIREWQELWTGYKGSTWTRSLIPNIDSWYYRRHGELSFHTSQMLTGHGCFQKYLYDIKKTESPLCLYCKKDEDTAEHTFMECTHWEKQREETNLKIGKDLKTNNIGINFT